MKVLEILKLCNGMADLQLPERYFAEQSDALADERITKLVYCCNSLLEQLYCDYATALKKCTLVATDGFADTSGLDFNRVVSLVDSNGNNVRYRYTKGGLSVADGTYTLTYASLPQRVGWTEEVEMPSPRITPRIFAYGCLAEYFFSVGDVGQSSLWNDKFLNALKTANVKKSAMTMPLVGRWL